MRFSIRQVLIAFLWIACLFVLSKIWFANHYSLWLWSAKPLVFVSPQIPVAFNDNGRGSPSIVFTPSLGSEYDSGRHLFLQEYRRGWELQRLRFFESNDFDLSMVQAKPVSELSPDTWTVEHVRFATLQGRNKCSKQIFDLLEDYTDDELRRRLGYSKLWLMVPLILTLLVCMVLSPFLKPKRIRENED